MVVCLFVTRSCVAQAGLELAMQLSSAYWTSDSPILLPECWDDRPVPLYWFMYARDQTWDLVHLRKGLYRGNFSNPASSQFNVIIQEKSHIVFLCYVSFLRIHFLQKYRGFCFVLLFAFVFRAAWNTRLTQLQNPIWWLLNTCYLLTSTWCRRVDLWGWSPPDRQLHCSYSFVLCLAYLFCCCFVREEGFTWVHSLRRDRVHPGGGGMLARGWGTWSHCIYLHPGSKVGG